MHYWYFYNFVFISIYIFETLLLKEFEKKETIIWVYLLCSLLIMLVSSSITIGIYIVFIKIVIKEKVTFFKLFEGFVFFLKAFALIFVNNLIIVFATLFFIVPGIILAYNYSMSYFDRQSGLVISQIRRQSTKIMSGKKLKLFCLELSFIGWIFLATITLGLASAFTTPYMITSIAYFYEQLDKKFHLNNRFDMNEKKEIFERVTKRDYAPRSSYNNPFR